MASTEQLQELKKYNIKECTPIVSHSWNSLTPGWYFFDGATEITRHNNKTTYGIRICLLARIAGGYFRIYRVGGPNLASFMGCNSKSKRVLIYISRAKINTVNPPPPNLNHPKTEMFGATPYTLEMDKFIEDYPPRPIYDEALRAYIKQENTAILKTTRDWLSNCKEF